MPFQITISPELHAACPQFVGTAVLANIVLGFAMKNAGLQLTFLLLLGACAASILLMGLTYKAEQYLVRKNG